MKHHVWSKPDLQWEGFQPVAYSFGTEKIWALPLTRKYDDGKADEPTTVGDIIVLLRDKQLKPESFERGVLESEFVAADDSLKVTVKGPSFNCDLLRIILQLHSEDIGALESVWYYFDHDSCRQEPHEMYFFFVVAKNKIVRERVGFSDYLDSGFDPTIFETHDYKDMIWGDEADWDEADTRYWYRKFYTETRTGQLMALRPDDPQLFYCERTGPDPKEAGLLLYAVQIASCNLQHAQLQPPRDEMVVDPMLVGYSALDENPARLDELEAETEAEQKALDRHEEQLKKSQQQAGADWEREVRREFGESRTGLINGVVKGHGFSRAALDPERLGL